MIARRDVDWFLDGSIALYSILYIPVCVYIALLFLRCVWVSCRLSPLDGATTSSARQPPVYLIFIYFLSLLFGCSCVCVCVFFGCWTPVGR